MTFNEFSDKIHTVYKTKRMSGEFTQPDSAEEAIYLMILAAYEVYKRDIDAKVKTDDIQRI